MRGLCSNRLHVGKRFGQFRHSYSVIGDAIGAKGRRLGAHPVAKIGGGRRAIRSTPKKTVLPKSSFPTAGPITLKPNSSVKIQQFRFKQEEPEKDSLVFGLVKGGLRAVTGLVGKRGDQDAYSLGTATATIGIRGTSYGADDCLTTPCPKPNSSDSLEPGVYVSVTDGEIVATNNAGSQNFLAGQFGAISDRNSRPRFLSTDPGLQFTPPATFIQSIMTGAAANAGKRQECVSAVRPLFSLNTGKIPPSAGIFYFRLPGACFGARAD